MSLRVVIRSPFETEPLVRGVVHGAWAEPAVSADSVVGDGMWALPGLADAHSHLAAEQLDYQPGDLEGAIERARRALHAGVLLLLDKGWTDDVGVRVASLLPEDERPDIESAARIIAAPGGYYPEFAREVNVEDLVGAVGEEARAALGWVKLIGDWPRKGVGPVANFTEEELRSAVAAAGEAGCRVAIHTMARDVPSVAVAAGVHSIEHGLFLTEDDLDALAARGGMWVPTVLRNEDTLAMLGPSSSGGKLFVEGLERIRSLLPLAAEAGVHVLAGTDLIGAPADVAAEALRLGEYGLTPSQIVASVSTQAYDATGRAGYFDPGRAADAVFFAADPLLDPGVLAHPAAVMRRGRLV